MCWMKITGNQGYCVQKKCFSKMGLKQRHFKINKDWRNKISTHSPKEIVKDELQTEGRSDCRKKLRETKMVNIWVNINEHWLYQTIIIMSDEIKRTGISDNINQVGGVNKIKLF